MRFVGLVIFKARGCVVRDRLPKVIFFYFVVGDNVREMEPEAVAWRYSIRISPNLNGDWDGNDDG